MFFRLLALFTLLPLVELLLLIRIGELIGVLATVALVITTGVLGAFLTRIEGMKVLRRVRTDLQAGRVPTDRLLDALLILLAGAVLLTPGLITDALGFFLLVPPGRRVIREAVAAAAKRKFGAHRPPVIDAEWRRNEE